MLVFLIFLYGCKSTTEIYTYNEVRKGDFYFPLKTEISKKEIDCKLDTFENSWYSKHLYSLKEPILFKTLGGNISVYRYTNLGTWSPPLTYRVEKKDSLVTITKRMTDGQGGYKSGKLIFNKTKILSMKEWQDLKNKLDSISFWSMPTHENIFGLDGSEWILEGIENNKYTFVTRWSPDSHGDQKFVRVCNYFEEIFLKGK
jgi:hypothetical protein